jgi:adenine-specific DNA-methyltransferase
MMRLGMMLDEVFGENNRIGIINWQKNYASKSNAGHISSVTEYVFVYVIYVICNNIVYNPRFVM